MRTLQGCIYTLIESIRSVKSYFRLYRVWVRWQVLRGYSRYLSGWHVELHHFLEAETVFFFYFGFCYRVPVIDGLGYMN